MTDRRSRSPPPALPSAGTRPPTAPPSIVRATRRGQSDCSTATRRLWSTRPAGPGRRSPSASAGSMRRPISPTRSRPSRASARASATPASRRRSSPGWAAAASRRTSSSGRSAVGRRLARPARPRLDRPGGGRRDGRRPRPARDAVHRRQQVRHDDGAAGVPGRCLGRGSKRPSARRHAPRNEHAGELMVAITDPGQERRGDPPPRRAPRGVPQPARHRRALLRR